MKKEELLASARFSLRRLSTAEPWMRDYNEASKRVVKALFLTGITLVRAWAPGHRLATQETWNTATGGIFTRSRGEYPWPTLDDMAEAARYEVMELRVGTGSAVTSLHLWGEAWSPAHIREVRLIVPRKPVFSGEECSAIMRELGGYYAELPLGQSHVTGGPLSLPETYEAGGWRATLAPSPNAASSSSLSSPSS